MRGSRRTRVLKPACVLAALAVLPALADVDLRFESRPATRPIEAFVRVREDGEAVTGLVRGDFSVTLDGQRLTGLGFRLPVEQDPGQSLSIVFVMADGRALESAIPALAQLPVGAYASIIRVRYQAGDPTPWLRLHPFTRVDGDTGSRSLAEFLQLSIYDLSMLRYGSRTPHLDLLSAGLEQLETPGTTLPRGPKAIVLVGNGRYVESWSRLTQSDLIARANGLGVPVFTIGTENFRGRPEVAAFMTSVARDTGGTYFRGYTPTSMQKAYRTILAQLVSAYRLVIPAARVTDCDPHMLEVTVRGEVVGTPFSRCDTTPDPLVFQTVEGVAPAKLAVSNAATITGADSAMEISVFGGWYSLGCRSSFTRVPGIARPGDLVCVRHVATGDPGALTETTLVIGGVASSFHSTTRAASA